MLVKRRARVKKIFEPEEIVLEFCYQRMFQNEPRILILDDDPAITDLLCDILQQEGYKVMASNSPKDVLFLARQFRPDLLLLDIMMPEVDGYDVCAFFKRDPELKFTRIIVLSARSERESRIKSYKSRADVFLPKPFDIDELREVVQSNLLSKAAADDIIADLERQVITDRTLQCYNKKYIEKRASEELKRGERYGYAISAVLFQLDNFEPINVRYGFAFGNEVKKDVVRAVRNELRELDLIGRYAENSFIILLPDTSEEGLKIVSSRLHDVLSSMIFLQKKRLTLDPTIAALTAERAQKLEDLIALLEEELQRQRARKHGKI